MIMWKYFSNNNNNDGEHLYSAFPHIHAQSALTLIITLKDQESNPYLILSQLPRKSICLLGAQRPAFWQYLLLSIWNIYYKIIKSCLKKCPFNCYHFQFISVCVKEFPNLQFIHLHHNTIQCSHTFTTFEAKPPTFTICTIWSQKVGKP